MANSTQPASAQSGGPTQPAPPSTRDKLSESYDRFAARTKEIFAEAGEKSAAWLDEAMDKAREQLVQAGEITREEGEKLRQYLKQDLEATGVDLEELRRKAETYLAPSRLSAGFLDLTAHLMHRAGGVFEDLASRSDKALVRRTGEITGPGTLRCSTCDNELHYEHSGRVPPCPTCKGTEFRRRY